SGKSTGLRGREILKKERIRKLREPVSGYALLAAVQPDERLSLLFLFVLNLKDTHRTGFRTDSASDTFGSNRRLRNFYHNAHRTGFHTLAAADTKLFVDHVSAFCILRNGTVRTDAGTFAALNTYMCFDCAVLLHDTDTGFLRIKDFVESCGAGNLTLKTCLAGRFVGYYQFFHNGSSAYVKFPREIPVWLIPVYCCFAIFASVFRQNNGDSLLLFVFDCFIRKPFLL